MSIATVHKVQSKSGTKVIRVRGAGTPGGRARVQKAQRDHARAVSSVGVIKGIRAECSAQTVNCSYCKESIEFRRGSAFNAVQRHFGVAHPGICSTCFASLKTHVACNYCGAYIGSGHESTTSVKREKYTLCVQCAAWHDFMREKFGLKWHNRLPMYHSVGGRAYTR